MPCNDSNYYFVFKLITKKERWSIIFVTKYTVRKNHTVNAQVKSRPGGGVFHIRTIPIVSVSDRQYDGFVLNGNGCG